MLHLNLTDPIIAEIYNDSLSYWNDPQIAMINPAAISYLHHDQIIPYYRLDGNDETLMFTRYLSTMSQCWNSTVGDASIVNWPSGFRDKCVLDDEEFYQRRYPTIIRSRTSDRPT